MPVLVCALMTSNRGMGSPWQQPKLNTSYLVTVVKRGHLVKNSYIKGGGEGGRVGGIALHLFYEADNPAFKNVALFISNSGHIPKLN